MRLTFSTIILVMLVLVISVFVANISNLIAVQVNTSNGENQFASQASDKSKRGKNLSSTSVMGDKYEHLMWFLQISDIHVSIFHEASRITQFQEFCEKTVAVIRPSVVLATGDLTDAKTADNMGSTQQLEEWEIYKNILSNSDISSKTVWLDIRGNHDNFNIPDKESRLNYYREYTIQGSEHPHSYLHSLTVNGSKYGFLGIDACLSPGPKRPFNFVGTLRKSEADHVRQLIQQAQSEGVEYTITFGHYPTSCIISSAGDSPRQLIPAAPGCWVYVCGHFHTLGGVVSNMYTLQKTGYLELELGDWKDNRIFRLAAMDNGHFSFVDVNHGQWPVILVTNPKHALYAVPHREHIEDITASTHVRVLVFSLDPIVLVQVRVDDGPWYNATGSGGPLFTCPWMPSLYKVGLHRVAVRVRDEQGREHGVEQPFSLDGTRLDFRFWPRFVLMSNISALFQTLFGLALCLSVVPLCCLRVLHVLVRRRKLARPVIRSRWARYWVRSFWLLATVDRVFFPLVIYALYLSVGPWAVGEMIDGYVGAVFAWGLVVNNSYLPGSFTYAYGFLQLVGFQLPLTFILARALERRLRELKGLSRPSHLQIALHHFPFVFILVIQTVCAYFFWLAYGTLAFVLGPLRTWSIVLACILWWFSNKAPVSCFREADTVWSLPDKDSSHDIRLSPTNDGN